MSTGSLSSFSWLVNTGALTISSDSAMISACWTSVTRGYDFWDLQFCNATWRQVPLHDSGDTLQRVTPFNIMNHCRFSLRNRFHQKLKRLNVLQRLWVRVTGIAPCKIAKYLSQCLETLWGISQSDPRTVHVVSKHGRRRIGLFKPRIIRQSR